MEAILNASYGDKKQKPPPLRKPGMNGRIPLAQQDQPQPDVQKGYRPPFWDSKLYGQPFGDFNLPPKKGKPRPTSAGRAAPAGRPSSARVAGENAGSERDARGVRPALRPASAGRQRAARPGAAPGRLQQLEEKMRSKLAGLRTPHMVERAILQRAFQEVDRMTPGKVAKEDFVDVWRRLGVKLTVDEAGSFYNKYGQDRNGLMPVKVFMDGLLVGQSRLLGRAADVQQGAYRDPRNTEFKGKIIYPPCRKGVFAPTSWDTEMGLRSGEMPNKALQLEFVYGYNGNANLAPNLFYIKTGEVAYYTAAVAIVYNKESHRQRFFQEHDDDIKCIALNAAKDTCATGQVGREPYVCVWHPHDMKMLQRLDFPYGARGVVAVSFSPDGGKLACVTTDNDHTIYVWDWRRRAVLNTLKGLKGTPPQVYGVQWNPFAESEFVSYGASHIKWWTRSSATSYALTAGAFAKAGTHDVLSMTFLPSGVVVTGMPTGELCIWKNSKCVRVLKAHAKGPQVKRDDGQSITFGGVRCLRLRAGADGTVLAWDVSSGEPKSQDDILGTIALKSPYQNCTAPALRALDCLPGSNVFIAGTNRCDIWEVDETPEVMIYGHSADLYGLAVNPVRPERFATACESDRVFLFDAVRRHMLRTVSLGGIKARSVAFSPDGAHLAVGMRNGGLNVLEADTLQFLKWSKNFDSAVDDLKYSPDGRLLALGSHDTFIDVYSVDKDYKRIARCSGHSATITHLDWSVDSSTIMSNCGAYEVLYWNARDGSQVKQNQRDTDWATWTCILGFPVMGIWPEGSDGTDVNSIDRSPSSSRWSGGIVVTADDLGQVKLFNYPCVIHRAPF
ncbi:hypothetical protein CYMTET_28194, partial [Cymbomonas tetramitiformis]